MVMDALDPFTIARRFLAAAKAAGADDGEVAVSITGDVLMLSALENGSALMQRLLADGVPVGDLLVAFHRRGLAKGDVARGMDRAGRLLNAIAKARLTGGES